MSLVDSLAPSTGGRCTGAAWVWAGARGGVPGGGGVQGGGTMMVGTRAGTRVCVHSQARYTPSPSQPILA